MLKKSLMTMIALSMSAELYAGINFDNPGANNFKEEISNVEVPVPAAPGLVTPSNTKEWTIMVYFNGKNNLEGNALTDMNEMEMIGSSDRVNVVVELGRMDGYDQSDGDWKTARRYLVKRDNDIYRVTSPVVKDLGKVDMGDYKHLADFGKWAKTNYPAKKYMLIVWNHGSGWVKSIGRADKGISYDYETGNHISTPQLGMALKAIGKVDIYASDACLMQMAEVGYEIKDYADYIVGSEETESSDGYTYNTLLGPLVAKPGMGAEELGKLAVDSYSDHYQSQGVDSTHSLVKASALDGLIPLVNDFVATVMASKDSVKTAINQAQSYIYHDNKDMSHFLTLYMAFTKNAAIKAKAQSLQNYLLNKLVIHNRVTGSYGASKGLAIYMPGSPNLDYRDLAWAKASQWDEFINWYTMQTLAESVSYADTPATPVEWVNISGGKFTMGRHGFENAKPIHEVAVKTFDMSKTAVTVEQYAECVIKGQCAYPVFSGPDCNWGTEGREHHPINCVSWDQADQYAKFKGGRLPSESEWEYAATSGGRNQKYPWGNDEPTCDRAVMYGNGGFGCGTNTTWPVCSKPAGNTAQGLCDMSGNVLQWVQDRYQNSYTGAPIDGGAFEGPGTLRVMRGGSFYDSVPKFLQAEYRGDGNPSGSNGDFGFRIAR